METDGVETSDQNIIANGFNKFFIEIGANFASSVPTSKEIKQFMNVIEIVLHE